MSVDLAALRRQSKRILAIASERGVSEVRVFGSVARGQEREGSDVDFLVRFSEDCTLLDIAGLTADLEDLLGCSVDVIGDDELPPDQTAELNGMAVAL